MNEAGGGVAVYKGKDFHFSRILPSCHLFYTVIAAFDKNIRL